nr:DUF2778 domain-containing protein [Erwinia sp. JUb26]
MGRSDEDNMHGRNLFRIHGDSREHPGEASEGCIILGPDARREIINSIDKTLIVE